MHSFSISLLLFATVSAPAGVEKMENYPDGDKHLVYLVNERGEKSGDFHEYYPGGKVKVQATYRDGKLVGPYKEFAADGKPSLAANYRDGKLHGLRQEYAAGRLVREEMWYEGELLVPQSGNILAARLKAIPNLAIETVGEIPETTAAVKSAVENRQLHGQREAGLRVLMAYRCVAGLPYADLALDRGYIAHDEAASLLLTKLGKLTHSPENPGWPEAEFKFAAEGCACSNISTTPVPTQGVPMFCDDSDDGNIDRLGHRRWCLNPAMARTGFGCGGSYGAMWSFDASRKEVPDFDFIAFPPKGLTPVAFFKESMPWSVSLNPAKYQPPAEERVKVKLVAAKFNPKQGTLQKGTDPLKLNYFKVNRDGFGIPNCIIFRPAPVSVAPGAAYWVEISGLKNKDDADATIQYLVAFVGL